MIKFLNLIGLLGGVAFAAENAFEDARLQKAEFLNTLTSPITFDVLSTYVNFENEGTLTATPGCVFDIKGKQFATLQVKNYRSNTTEILQKQTLTLNPNDKTILEVPFPHYLKGVKGDIGFEWDAIEDGLNVKLGGEGVRGPDNNAFVTTPIDLKKQLDLYKKLISLKKYVDLNSHYGFSFEYFLNHGVKKLTLQCLSFKNKLRETSLDLFIPKSDNLILRIKSANCWMLIFENNSLPCLIQGDRVHTQEIVGMKNVLMLSTEPRPYININKNYSSINWSAILSRGVVNSEMKSPVIKHNSAISVDVHLLDEAIFNSPKKYAVSYLLSTSQGNISANPWGIPDIYLVDSPFLYGLRIKIYNEKDKISMPKYFYVSARDKENFQSSGNLVLSNYSKKELFYSMFHICVENTIEQNYFTEKILDSFLGGSIPIYKGCPNIGDYFDENGIIFFNDEEDLINILSRIDLNYYYSKIDSINKNRELALKFIQKNSLKNILNEYFPSETKENQKSILTHYPLNLIYFVVQFSSVYNFEFLQLLLRLIIRI